MTGLRTTRVQDWKIAFDDISGVAIGVGFHAIDFVIASESAQVIQPFRLSGETIGTGIGASGLTEKSESISRWIHELMTPEKSLFWPLKIKQPISVFDIDLADGKASIIHIGTTLVLRFDAWQGRTLNTSTKPLGQPKATGLLFEHPASGMPIPDQFPALKITGLHGQWRYNGNGSCCWDKSKP